MALLKTNRQLIELIATMQTPQDVEQVKKLTSYRLHWPEFHNALFDRLTELLQSYQLANSTSNGPGYIQQDGIVYDLTEWLTFRTYIQRHGINSTSVLNNWISRGIVLPECVVEIAVLNDLKLIRNQVYQLAP